MMTTKVDLHYCDRETLCKTVSKIEVLVLDLSLSKASSRGHVRSANAPGEALLPPESTAPKKSELSDDD